MTTPFTSNHKEWLLNFPAYLTLILVMVVSWPSLPTDNRRWIILGLYAAFGIGLAFYFQTEEHPKLVHLYLLTQTAIVTALVLLDLNTIGEPGTLLFVLSAQAILFLPARIGILWIILYSSLTLGTIVFSSGIEHVASGLTSVGGYVFFGTFGLALRQADAARRESDSLLGQLQVAHEQLKVYSVQEQELAIANERNRLAREMHDALGHRLTVAVVQLEGAQRLVPTDPGRATTIITTMRQQLKQALNELRQTIGTLRDPNASPDPLRSPDPAGQPHNLPLSQALPTLIHTFQEATHLPIHLTLPEQLPTLTNQQEKALYRTAQELLTNIQRHAQATQATLTLQNTPPNIILTVSDNGQGLPTTLPEGCFGLRGLQERAQQLGGQLIIESRPGTPTQITLTLPLAPRSNPL